MPGARCTRGLVCQKSRMPHMSIQVQRQHSGIPRNGFTAYFVLSPVSGLCCHRHLQIRSASLDASIAAPGPHDFAVRLGRSVRRLRA